MSASAGLWKPLGRRSSQNRLPRLLPMTSTKATCSGSQVSRVVDRTLDRCVPRERWMPEQFRQTKTPRLTEALNSLSGVSPVIWKQSAGHDLESAQTPHQVGPLAWQSAQRLLSSSFSSPAGCCWSAPQDLHKQTCSSFKRFQLPVSRQLDNSSVGSAVGASKRARLVECGGVSRSVPC